MTSLTSASAWAGVGLMALFAAALYLAPRLAARARAARAKAQCPDYGHLTPRERSEWDRIKAFYDSAAADFEPDQEHFS